MSSLEQKRAEMGWSDLVPSPPLQRGEGSPSYMFYVADPAGKRRFTIPVSDLATVQDRLWRFIPRAYELWTSGRKDEIPFNLSKWCKALTLDELSMMLEQRDGPTEVSTVETRPNADAQEPESSAPEVVEPILANIMNIREFVYSNEDRLRRIEKNLTALMGHFGIEYTKEL